MAGASFATRAASATTRVAEAATCPLRCYRGGHPEGHDGVLSNRVLTTVISGCCNSFQRQAVISPWKPGTGDESFSRAEVAALLGDRDAAVLWLQRSYREGWGHRGYVHIDPAFRRMRGYGPWEALIKPVEDPAHESLLGR